MSIHSNFKFWEKFQNMLNKKPSFSSPLQFKPWCLPPEAYQSYVALARSSAICECDRKGDSSKHELKIYIFRSHWVDRFVEKLLIQFSSHPKKMLWRFWTAYIGWWIFDTVPGSSCLRCQVFPTGHLIFEFRPYHLSETLLSLSNCWSFHWGYEFSKNLPTLLGLKALLFIAGLDLATEQSISEDVPTMINACSP